MQARLQNEITVGDPTEEVGRGFTVPAGTVVEVNIDPTTELQAQWGDRHFYLLAREVDFMGDDFDDDEVEGGA